MFVGNHGFLHLGQQLIYVYKSGDGVFGGFSQNEVVDFSQSTQTRIYVSAGTPQIFGAPKLELLQGPSPQKASFLEGK